MPRSNLNDPQNPQNHQHRRDGDAAAITPDVIRAKPSVIRAKPAVIRAKPEAIKGSINPIKAAWLSIRGMNLINGRSSTMKTTMKTTDQKTKSIGAAARGRSSETSGLDSDAESVISASTRTISAANRSISVPNHSPASRKTNCSLHEQQRQRRIHGEFSSHSARHDHHRPPPPPPSPPPPRRSPDHPYYYYCRDVEDQLMYELQPREWAHHMRSASRPAPCSALSSCSLMNGAEAEREMEAAMAMDAMEARLMEARWRRDEAIAEMEEMRAALEEKRMTMAMAKLQGQGAAAAAGEKQRRR
jgi:hypothetical protein